MMGRFLVIDLGDHAIKTVLLSKTLKTIKILNYERVLIPRDIPDRKSFTRDIIHELCNRENLRADDYFAVISSSLLFFRNISLEFNERRKIKKILPLQLETMLPLKQQDFLADFILTSHRSNGANEVFCAVARTTDINDYLELFKFCGISLSGLKISPVSMASFFQHVNREMKNDIVLIDIGQETTKVTILENGVLRYSRNIFWGSRAVDDLIENHFHIDMEEKESFTFQRNLLDESKYEKYVSVIYEGCREGMEGIDETLKYYLMKLGGNKPVAMCLYGGGALIPGITDVFEKQFQVSCSVFAEEIDIPFLDGINTKDISLYLPAIAVGYSAARRSHNDMELLQGKYKPTRGINIYRKQLVTGGILLFILLVLNVYFIQSSVAIYENQVMKLDNIRRTILLRNIPETSVVANPELQLQSYLQREKNRVPGMFKNKLIKNKSAINILRLIHQKIPREINLTLKELQIDQNRVFMIGETNTLESIIQVKGALETIPVFGEIDLSSQKKQGETGEIQFTLKIPLLDHDGKKKDS